MTVDSSGKSFILPSGPTSLCFDKEDFMKKDFEIDKFIMDCRKRVPLEVLRDDLDLYLKVLRSAMIELINKDYADFVNLSTNLVGMDKTIGNLTTPLGQLKEEVLSVQVAMDQAIQAVQGKVQQQIEIQRKKAVLQRLININNSVEKIEKLLGIQQNESSSVSSDLTGPLIERVATEFNKLQFYVTRSKGHPMVEKVKPRIAAITTTLQYSLEGSFLSGLDTGNAAMLRQCLRTYALIDKTRDAEALFREHVVRPYMEEVICEEFLRSRGNNVSTMFEEVLEFIPAKCALLNDITRGTSGGEVVRGYDFLVNAVFPEVVTSLEIRLNQIFAPGNPEVFHVKYTACMNFLEQLEIFCGNLVSVKRLRHHPSYTALMNRWSLPVYFQIRFQEIAGSFEQALGSGFMAPPDSSEFKLAATNTLWKSMLNCWDDKVFLQSLTHKFLKFNLQSLSRFKTWLTEAHQEEISSRSDVTTESAKGRSATPDKITVSSHSGNTMETGQGDIRPRSASPKPRESPKPTLRVPITNGQFVSILSDLDVLERKVPVLIETLIKPRLESIGFEDITSAKAAMMEGVTTICECRPHLWSILSEDVIKRCSGSLCQVNDIPRLYRRTNKEMPSKPSAYLASVMRPLIQFCEEHSRVLSEQQKVEFLTHVFCRLTQGFSEVTLEVLTSTRKMEESLRRLKKARGGEKDKEKSGVISDSDKIRSQIILDINGFMKQMETLGLCVKEAGVEGYDKLQELSSKAKADMDSS